ncbi:hypothetical protein NL676_022146 [Syzygium grande]|nr:hypothetical protein NL676_022146 [Syzygium grande]
MSKKEDQQIDKIKAWKIERMHNAIEQDQGFRRLNNEWKSRNRQPFGDTELKELSRAAKKKKSSLCVFRSGSGWGLEMQE